MEGRREKEGEMVNATCMSSDLETERPATRNN